MQSQEDKQVTYKLKCITIISLLFMTVEIVGGLMANSVAILSDAFHLLSDIIAYMISLQAVLMSSKKAPFYLTFGYQKLQPLGALVNVAIIWFVTIQLVIEATQRILNKSIVEQPFYMLLTSFFGLGCNLYIMRVLHSDPHGGHSCSHDHGEQGHNHDHSHSHGKKHDHKHDDKNACKSDHQNHSHDHKDGHNHDHKNQQKCNHDHDHNHNHHNGQNKDEHNHDHHDHKHDHQHDHKDHSNCNGHHEQKQVQIEAVCELEHDHDLANCNKKGYYLVSKQCLNEQIINNFSTTDDLDKIDEKQQARKILFKNINIQAAYIHIISDIILSIGVIISAIIIYFATDPKDGWTPWQFADPFCTYLFSIMAIYSTIGIIKDSCLILLDGCDDPSMLKDITAELQSIKDVKSYQELRVWSLNRNKFAAAVKIGLAKQKYDDIEQRDEIRNRVIRIFSRREISHYIQVEEHVEKQ